MSSTRRVGVHRLVSCPCRRKSESLPLQQRTEAAEAFRLLKKAPPAPSATTTADCATSSSERAAIPVLWANRRRAEVCRRHRKLRRCPLARRWPPELALRPQGVG